MNDERFFNGQPDEDFYNRGLTGLWVDRSILELVYQGKLDARHAFLHAIIRSYHKEDEGCWATNATLARQIGVSDDSTVRRGLKVLEKAGLLVRYERKHTWGHEQTKQAAMVRYLFALLPGQECPEATRQECPEATRQECPTSSTKVSNTKVSAACSGGLGVDLNGRAPQPSGTYYQMAKYMKEHQKDTLSRWVPKVQADHFRKLCEDVDKDKVWLVLKWFCDQPRGSNGLPDRCTSPKTFYSCFGWILDVYEKHNVPEPSSKAKKFCDSFPNWPRRTVTLLPILDKSFSNVEVIKGYLHQEIKTAKRGRWRNFLEHLHQNLPSSSEYFGTYYAERIGFGKWKGKVDPISVQCEYYHEWGERISVEYAGGKDGPELWQRFVDGVTEYAN